MSRKRPESDEDDGTPYRTPPRRSAGFVLSLLYAIENPKLHVFSDEKLVVIRDKFPKSRHHYLLLPRCPIDKLTDLTAANVPLMEHMMEQGKKFVASHISSHTKNAVRCGFHMVTSVKQLHMHMISQDFDNMCLKNKKQWNSYTGEFFMETEKVLGMLKGEGKVLVDIARGEQLLKQDLKCHVCRIKLTNIPKLKEHIKLHDKDRGKDGLTEVKKVEVAKLGENSAEPS